VGDNLDPASLSSQFDLVADISAERGRFETALRLGAIADRIKKEVGGAAPPTLIRPGDVRAKATASGRLSEGEIDTLWAEGLQMSPQEGVALARKEGA
jgi:hypothetical protein